MDAPPLPPSGPNLTGRRLGDYHITRLLGQGGMATVYQATQNSLHRDVAFKVLKPELAAKSEHVSRFLDEARSAARVVHPNIVQIYDMGEMEGLHFIAQELVTGANLKQVLKRDGQLPVAMTINIMRQVALALHKAAEGQVIHRDIKPENVLLSASGEVKVADFGLARAAWDPDSVRKTHPGMVMGTPLYMSPEQIEDGEVDHRSDLYSLGVTCYHLLAGKPPFDGDTPMSVAIQHLRATPTPLPLVRDEVPDAVWRIISKLMEKAPERRYQDAVELLRDLRHLVPNGDNSDDWAVQELVSLTEARTQASQQLQRAMTLEQQRRRTGLYSGIVLIVGLVLAIPLGIAAAYITRDKPLLNRRARPAAAEALPTIQEQYTHAVVVGTDEAIRAVWTHHRPTNSGEEFLVNKAKRRLAQSLVAQNRFNEAKPLFDELASLPATETEFRVFGQLGQAMILWHDDRQQDAALLISAALKDLAGLPQVQRDVVLQTLQPELKKRVQERLEDFRRGKRKSDVRDST